MLNQYKDIVLAYDEGLYFKLSIKHDIIKLLNFLLQHYEQTMLKGAFNSIEYQVPKYKLQQILKDAENTLRLFRENQVEKNTYLKGNMEIHLLNEV